MIGFVIRRRHDPQLLLTDQRTPEKKRADALVEQFRGLYPSVIDWAGMHRTLDPSTFASGGFIGEPYSPTGRRRRSDPIPHLFPGDEIVMTKRRAPSFNPVEIDFGATEARVLAHTVTHMRMQIDTRRFREAMRGASEAMQRLSRTLMERREKAYLRVLFGDVDLDEPEPDFTRERRIALLLGSNDRRQRKRGERLFAQWQRETKA